MHLFHYPNTVTRTLGLELHATNRFSGDAVVAFMDVGVQRRKYTYETCRVLKRHSFIFEPVTFHDTWIHTLMNRTDLWPGLYYYMSRLKLIA